jgi:hypothetical protein
VSFSDCEGSVTLIEGNAEHAARHTGPDVTSVLLMMRSLSHHFRNFIVVGATARPRQEESRYYTVSRLQLCKGRAPGLVRMLDHIMNRDRFLLIDLRPSGQFAGLPHIPQDPMEGTLRSLTIGFVDESACQS